MGENGVDYYKYWGKADKQGNYHLLVYHCLDVAAVAWYLLDFKDRRCKYLSNKTGLIPIYSNERLSGGPHTGGSDSAEIARRIKICAPSSKIIIIIREQEDMILSSYSQYIRAVGSASLKE